MRRRLLRVCAIAKSEVLSSITSETVTRLPKMCFTCLFTLEMSKRRHYGSTGDTPGKAAPKKSDKPDRKSELSEKPPRRNLFDSSSTDTSGRCAATAWSREETRALVEYVALYWEGAHTNGWPSHKDEKFWEACSRAIVDATDLPKRTGTGKLIFAKYDPRCYIYFLV